MSLILKHPYLSYYKIKSNEFDFNLAYKYKKYKGKVDSYLCDI